jgi:hypothetical protein
LDVNADAFRGSRSRGRDSDRSFAGRHRFVVDEESFVVYCFLEVCVRPVDDPVELLVDDKGPVFAEAIARVGWMSSPAA